MRIVFFGTPDYVLPILDEVNKAFKGRLGESPVVAVVTQPPRPVGRQKVLKYSPIDTWAHKRNIPKYFDPMDLVTNNIMADLGILASYGQFIPSKVAKIFTHGIIVIHPSLLPGFRGSSPVPATLITNHNPTGVSIFKLDEKLDHGPIITQFKEDVLPTDTQETLRNRLFALSAKILIEAIPAYIQGIINLKPQDEKKATYAKIINKSDAFISPQILKSVMAGKTPKTSWKIKFITDCKIKATPENVDRFFKAMQPWPGVWTQVDKNKRLKILKLHLEEGKILLDEVQLEGKNKVTWKQFCEAYPHLQLDR